MVVGKPDFNLNSFGIQYKEKSVNYTNKKAGINVASGTQTNDEINSENKVMREVKPTGTPPMESVKPKTDITGKKLPESSTPQPATSTTPKIVPKDGVFDNVPEKKEDMVIQEGGSSHIKKEPAMPRTKLHGRAHQESKAKLRELKDNPVLPKNASSDKIIMDMNILKLDLNKVEGEHCSNCGKNKKEMSDMTSMGGACPNCGDGFKPPTIKEEPKDLGKSAAETILKTISLKLDLMKINEFQAASTSARVGDAKHLKDVVHPDGLKIREASTIDERSGNTAPLERKDSKQTPKVGSKPEDL
tara:strand:- start:37 stop:942 length:906 start_codon:yes stop_codon:yes gene_type:complete